MNSLISKLDSILSVKVDFPVTKIRTFVKLSDDSYWMAKIYKYRNSKHYKFWITKFGNSNNNDYDEDYLDTPRDLEIKLEWLEENGFIEVSDKQIRVSDLRKMANEYRDLEIPEFIQAITGQVVAEADQLLERLSAFSVVEEIERFINRPDRMPGRAYDISSGMIATKKTLASCRKILKSLVNLPLSDVTTETVEKINSKIREIYLAIPHEPAEYTQVRDNYEKRLAFSPKKNLLVDPDSGDIASQMERISKNLQSELDTEEKRSNAIYDVFTPIVVPENRDSIVKNIEGINVTISDRDDALENLIKDLMGSQFERRYVNCWYVNNPETEKNFETAIKAIRGKKHKQERYLWHGSRTKNWVNIIKEGLRLPELSEHGQMFGRGCYFSPDVDKAIGYTSIDGSRWNHGKMPVGFIALYRVRIGNPLEIHNKQTLRELKKEGIEQYVKDKGYDSTLGIGDGIFLKKDEFCVYNVDQCTIYALVEIKAR